jgi:hypothetical protein
LAERISAAMNIGVAAVRVPAPIAIAYVVYVLRRGSAR